MMTSAGDNNNSDVITGAADDDDLSSSTESEMSDHVTAQSVNSDTGHATANVSLDTGLYYTVLFQLTTRVSAAADRPGSAHAKYSVLRHMVIKPFLLHSLAAKYRCRRGV